MKQPILNRIYRLNWNDGLRQSVVVSETSNPKCKAQKTIIARTAFLSLIALFSRVTLADPTGGVITSGAGNISQTTGLTTINQSSQTLSINWQTFNVGVGQTVNFVQPSSTALAINQILDTNGSRILGNINANGQVWLINPNGVFFGQGSQVNVGALLASTLNPLSQQGESTQVFGKGGTGSVINKGNINIANGGYIALIANKVSNQGNLIAPQGTVALAGGSQVTLSFADNELYQLKVDQSTLNNLAENKQLIQADGGTVFLSAGAKQSLLASIVNNEGIIEAQSVENKEGKIILLAGMAAGTTKVAGTLDASAEKGNGGFIETSAAKVNVADSVKITTKAHNMDNGSGKNGTWLIDPRDFIISASGGNITGTAVGNALTTSNVTIQTLDLSTSCAGVLGCTLGAVGNGDIFVNDAISWASNQTLTLSAFRNININQTITATGATGKLALEYGQGTNNGVISGNNATYNVNAKVNLQAGDNFTTKLGLTGFLTQYKVITSLGAQNSVTGLDLQGIKGILNGNYVLGADINAAATSGWNGGAGFNPLGDFGTDFSGIFDGLGHVINNLTINRTSTNLVGLFGATSTSALIQNVGLVNANMTGGDYVGGLVGINAGIINASSVSGQVTGSGSVGGLVGGNRGFGIINASSMTGHVSGFDTVGGLAGQNGGLIKNSQFVGNVSGQDNVGGIVGINVYCNDCEGSGTPGTINNSSATITSPNTTPQELTRILTQIQQHSGNPQTPTPNTLPLTEPNTQQPTTSNDANSGGDDDTYDVIQTYGCSA